MKTFKDIHEAAKPSMETTVSKVPNDWIYRPENKPGYDVIVHSVHDEIDNLITPGKYGHLSANFKAVKINVYDTNHKTALKKLNKQVDMFQKKTNSEYDLLYTSTTGIKGEDWTTERYKKKLFIGTAYLFI